MAKNDYVKVRLDLGGKLETVTITAKQNGSTLEIDTDKRDGKVTVTVLNRNGKETGEKHTFYPAAIRAIEESLSEKQ